MSRPGGVFGALIAKAGRYQYEQPIVSERADEWNKPDALQQNIAPWVGKDFLGDLVATFGTSILHPLGWNSRRDGLRAGRTIAPLLGKETVRAGDNQAEVSNRGLIHPGMVNFVYDPAADREPKTRPRRDRASHTALGSGRPRWL